MGVNISQELVPLLDDPKSRVNFLFDNRKQLLGGAFGNTKAQIDVIQERDHSDGSAVACVCKREMCTVAQTTLQTVYQSFSDPYFCFRLTFDSAKDDWFVDDFAFLEDPALGRFLRP